jgi:hypothetical protein
LDKAVYDICEKEVLLEYNTIKESLSDDSTIICQHLGTFTQEILISFVSLIEHALIESGEVKVIRKRLIYLIIECIQNIIFHSDKLPDNSQLAYMIISKNDYGYSIHTSNTVLSENIEKLVGSIDELLKVRKDVLAKLFTKKIEKPEINANGHGGIGLLTMISKSGKDFNYKVSSLTKEYSLFHIEININN